MFSLVVDSDIKLVLVDQTLAPQMLEIIFAEKAYLGRWLAWPAYTQCLDDYLTFVRFVLAEYAEGKSLACNIMYQEKPVGSVGFNCINHELKTAQIGYWLSEKALGKGIMTRACKKLIEFAFSALNLEKIEIAAAVNNQASRAVCERLGMRVERMIENAEQLNGNNIDHVYYVLYKQIL